MLSVKKHRSEVIKTMLADSQWQTITFMVKGKRICAPKVLLAAQSDVLAKMFDGVWKEAKEKFVTIEDIESEVFSELVHFLVAGEVSNCEAITNELLAAAEMVMSGTSRECFNILFASTNELCSCSFSLKTNSTTLAL